MFLKKLFKVALISCLAVACILGSITSFSKASADDYLSKVYSTKNYDQPYATDRVIVAYKKDTASLLAASGQLTAYEKNLSGKFGLRLKHNLSRKNDKYDVRLYTIDDSSQTVLDVINELKDDPNVAYVEPDYIIRATDRIPNDPYYSNLYAPGKISAPKAWDTHTGSKNVVVGVVDTGIQYTHPDLAGNIWVNPDEIPGNGKDDDNNGYIDDIYGWNFVSNNNRPLDDNGHGTHVAGIIGAVGNNGIGVTGVTWNTQIAALKFLDADGSGYTSNAILAINYAAEKGFDILNNSWGGGSYSQSLKNAIDAYKGVFVAAAGNEGRNNDSYPTYPASYTSSNIISVAATTSTDALASYSNYGRTSVDLGAPGSSIYSTYINSRYASLSGTSMAAPQVSGALALIKSYKPSLTTAQLKSLILNNVDSVSSLSNRTVTGGRLNVAKALAAAKSN